MFENATAGQQKPTRPQDTQHRSGQDSRVSTTIIIKTSMDAQRLNLCQKTSIDSDLSGTVWTCSKLFGLFVACLELLGATSGPFRAHKASRDSGGLQTSPQAQVIPGYKFGLHGAEKVPRALWKTMNQIRPSRQHGNPNAQRNPIVPSGHL